MPTTIAEAQHALMTPHERVFGGELQFAKESLTSLIILHQIRDKDNPRLQAMMESIDSVGLDNPVNIAKCSHQEFQDYVDFVNTVWGSEYVVENFADRQLPDGRYNLVVAGHSRTLSMLALASSHTEQTGQPTDYQVLCKIEKDNSVAAIVSKQAAENIHSNVPLEREAMAVVELYLFGLGTAWQSPDEFRKQHKGKVSSRMLKDALCFTTLSPQVRSLVLGGYTSYKVGVELGKASTTIFEYLASGIEGELDEEATRQLELAVNDHIMKDAATIWNKKLNPTAAIKYIEAYSERMRKEIVARQAAADAGDELAAFDLDIPELRLVSAAQQARKIRDDQARELALKVREINDNPFQKVAAFTLTLATEHDQVLEQVVDDMTAAHEMYLQRHRGRAVLRSVPDLDIQPAEAI